MKMPSPPCVQSLAVNRLSLEPLSMRTDVESRACTSPGSIRRPKLKLFLRNLLREECQSLRHVFEACEKSFSSSEFSSESTRTQPSQTRLALFPFSLDFVTRSRTIPPRRPFSPQPNLGS